LREVLPITPYGGGVLFATDGGKCHVPLFLIFAELFLQSILEEAFNINDIPRIIFVKRNINFERLEMLGR
jgi:hypothetical protein